MSISSFRGAGGEMVREYVSIVSYFSALPIAVLALLITWGCGTMGKNGTFFAIPLLFSLYVIALMRAAVPASRGDSTAASDLGEILSYAGRYAVVFLAGMIPIAGVVTVIVKLQEGPVSPFGFPSPIGLEKAGFLGIVLILLLTVAAFFPTLSLLVTLRHGTLREIFSTTAWRWLLVARQEDLVPFYSFLFGGAITMAGLSLLPAALIIYCALQVSLEATAVVSAFLYLWAGSTMPILTGLMAGAFVANEGPLAVAAASSGVPAPARPALARMPIAGPGGATPPSAAEEPVAAAEPRPDVRQIEQRLKALPETEIPAALAAAARKEQQAPLAAAVETTLLALRAGDRAGAIRAAGAGANLAASKGCADIGVFLFTSLGEDRMRLVLETTTLELMGKVLEQRLLYMDAAWCYHTAALKSGDPMKAQKRLFQTAETALKEGRFKESQALYELLLRKYPDSTLRDFARQGLDRVRRLAGGAKRPGGGT